MPPWHARLHLGSPSSKPSSTSKSPASRNPLPDRDLNGGYLPDPPLHGVPILPAKISSIPTAQPNPRHSRSHSHPFPSFFSSNKPELEELNGEEYHRTLFASDTQKSLLAGPSPKDATECAPHVNTTPSKETEMMIGRCCTCDSSVRFPRRLTTFSCPVCLMINDLKPMSSGPEGAWPDEPRAGDRVTHASSKAATSQKVPYISLQTTQHLIDECLDRFVHLQLRKGDKCLSLQAFHNSQNDRAPPQKIPAQTGALTVPSDPHASPQTSTKSLPSRALPPPSSTSISEEFSRAGTDPFQNIFRSLEDYIIACFASVDCLNASFSITRPPPVARAASEGTLINRYVSEKASDELLEQNPFPDLDAKTLLLGDFAENGTWWAGRSVPLEVNRPKTAKGQSNNLSDRVSLKSPRINWSEVNEWYSKLFSLQNLSRNRLQEIQVTGHLTSYASQTENHNQAYIGKCLAESCAHVHRTLFKATETLLRHPGRPLKSPSECRFLLILLANPLLSMSERGQPPALREVTLGSNPKLIGYDQGVTLKPPLILSRPSSSGSRRSPSVNCSSPKYSVIVKRIVGIMASLPPQCHHHLVNWFSRFSENHMRRIVDLIGSFVSYRLGRQNGRKRSNSHDPTAGGLIPNISGPGAGTSAQLHAAIGISTNPKSHGKAASSTLYGEDWQIKAAAKVMSLLFSANNIEPTKQIGHSNAYPLEHVRSRAVSAARRHPHRHGQLLPTNAFYNTMLDYSDLIADFETWESRRCKFSFCQYPMFLSIWAKIRIMEYDARRQMEIKAREAFFNSIMGRKAVNQYLVLKVRRDCLVEDSLRGVSEVVGTGQEEIKKGLRIEFVGEEGLDSGGLRKEWFLLLVREVFDVEHGLFVYDEESHYCYFNPNGFETSDQFFLVGVLLGLAIYNSTILDVALPPFAFRKLLASAPNHTGPTTYLSRPTYSHTLDDLAELRPTFARGLKQLLECEGNVEETCSLDFVAVTERFGQVQTTPLCPGGEQRSVTNSNREEYVDLYVHFLLDTAVSRQYEPFRRGFFTVCGGNALSLFRPEEIELLVRGSDEPLDIATLKAVAIYDNWGKGMQPSSEPQVQWFWNAFARANSKDQRKLLGFITASDRIPAMGTTSLVIKIVCLGEDAGRYPIARTCFNMIGLYRYQSQNSLESKLWRAVAEGEGFGMK